MDLDGDRASGRERGGEDRRRRRFDADDHRPRRFRVRGDRRAGQQPAAADGHDEHIDLRSIGEHFQRHGPGAGNHVVIVVRREVRCARPSGVFVGAVFGVLVGRRFDRLGAEAAERAALGVGCRTRHVHAR